MDNNLQIYTNSAKETKKVGEEFAHLLIGTDYDGKKRLGDLYVPKKLRILCLFGEIGSGKTTFIQGLARGFGIKKRILSPTYIIVRRYEIMSDNNFFYHIDLYREKNSSINDIGLEEIITSKNSFIAIEWAENYNNVHKSQSVNIYFSINSDNTHLIDIKRSL